MPITPFNDDKELLRQIADGDEKAFNQLVEKYWNRIYTVALTYLKLPQLAEDSVQEIFLKLWVKRETLSQVENLENFIFIVTRNEVLSALRKKGPGFPVGEWLETTLEDKEQLPDKTVSTKQLQSLIHSAIEALPPQQKQALKLSREEGLSHEEIASVMNLSTNTVKNHIVKALNTLRTFIQNHSDTLIFILISICFKKL